MTSNRPSPAEPTVVVSSPGRRGRRRSRIAIVAAAAVVVVCPVGARALSGQPARAAGPVPGPTEAVAETPPTTAVSEPVPAPAPSTTTAPEAHDRVQTAASGSTAARRPAAAAKRVAGPTNRPTPTPRPPTAPGRSDPGAYRFQVMDAGQPARWNPCAGIRWAYNPDQAPAGAQGFVAEALRAVAAATGLQFTYAGTTSYRPFLNRPSSAPSGVDAVIGFGTSAQYADFRDGTAGLGGFSWTHTDAGPRVTFGEVALNTTALRSVPAGFGAGRTQGGLILHELGHMVGLGHVGDATQLMNPSIEDAAPSGYGAGDRTGLHLVGSAAGCFPGPATPTTTKPAPTTTTTQPPTTSTTRPPTSPTTPVLVGSGSSAPSSAVAP